jgi:hypothetical protein
MSETSSHHQTLSMTSTKTENRRSFFDEPRKNEPDPMPVVSVDDIQINANQFITHHQKDIHQYYYF